MFYEPKDFLHVYVQSKFLSCKAKYYEKQYNHLYTFLQQLKIHAFIYLQILQITQLEHIVLRTNWQFYSYISLHQNINAPTAT